MKRNWIWAIGTLSVAIFGLLIALHIATSVPRPTGPRSLPRPALSTTGYPGVTAGLPISQGTAAVRPGLPHPFQVAPPHHDRLANFDKDGFLKNAQKLASRDDRPDRNGAFRRVTLYRTDLKYPFVRVEQQMQRLPGGQEVVLGESAVAADHVIVRAQPGATPDDVANAALQNGYTVLKPLHTPGYYLVQIPAMNLDGVPVATQALGRESGVLSYAEPDQVAQAELVPNDPDYSAEWSMNNTGQTGGSAHADISAPSAWTIINSSPNVIVAVVDSGIDLNHPDLVPNLWTNPHPGSLAGYANDLHGWNFYADNNSPQDDFFHGTHVSGTIGAVGNNGVGVAGVSWHVQLMPLKFLGNNGSGYTSDAVDAITYAVAMGAKVISNSWGGIGYSQALKDSIDAANNAGVLFVAAAGNDGVDTDTTPTYPACYTSANIIAVAATDDTDHLAYFSNYGTGTVQIAAPGVGIMSTFPTVATAAMTSEDLPTGYGEISGTSMATPLVSGAAALALAQNPSLTVAQLKNQLIQRADTLGQLAGLVQSAGRLDLYNVVNPNWTAGAASLQLSSTQFTDPEGNNDGTANPGEIIDLAPAIYNIGGVTANNVTAQITSQQTSATVLTSSLSLGTILPRQTVAAASPFRVQLSGSVPVGTVLSFDIALQGTGLPVVHGTATVTVQASRGYAEVAANFSVGEIQADPQRNLVYVTDTTNNRLLAIDTTQGQIAAIAGLATTSGAGLMAVSPDDTKLYLALPSSQKIQVFALPSLAPLGTLPVNFVPYGLAVGTGGRLYASGTTSTSSYGDPSGVYEISPATGGILQTFTFPYGFSGQFLLRASGDGTKLYLAPVGVSGYANVVSYNVSGTTAALIHQYSYDCENLVDFAVDDANNRLYLMNGGIYGVNVLDLGTGSSGTVWPLVGTYGAGVALLPGGSVVYGASQADGNVVEYDRMSGTDLRAYPVGGSNTSIQNRGIAITPNGNVLYVKSGGSAGTTSIGLIGGSTLNVTNPPITATGPSLSLTSVGFSDNEGNNDGVPNSGEIVDLTPTISNLGGQAATNTTVSISSDSNGAVLAPASQTIASIGVGQPAPTPASFRVQLASSLPVGTVVNLAFTITPAQGTAQTYPYTLVIQPNASNHLVASSVQYGEILADQQRDDIYMIDKTDMEIVAFDTDADHFTATAPMSGTTAVNWTGQASGMMAESVDGTALYVAEPQTKTIQKFSLPALTSVATWSYSFAPVSLACDAQGRLYASTTDSTQALVQINTTTGAVLTHSGPAFSNDLTLQGTGTILHRNSAGTELYATLATPAQSAIYRFSTAGAGAPTQLLSLTLPNMPVDFTVDEARSQFYVVLNDGFVRVLPFSGSGSTWSMTNQVYGGDAVSLLPGSAGLLAGLGATSDQIQLFAPGSGQEVYTYNLGSTGYEMKPRGLATTPNGRSLYVSTIYYGVVTNSVDGSQYEIGLIGGGTPNLQPPGSSPIGLQSLTVTDPAPGSADGYVHPGQTIQVAPLFENFLSIQLTSATVQLSTTDSYATVQAPATSTIGSVASYATFAPASPFKIAISPTAPDGHAISLSFVVSYNNGAQQIIPYTLYVSSIATVETQVNFQIGDVLSDPTRDLAYVIDDTNGRLLAIDTDAGALSKSVRLAASPGIGHMALSPDGSHLYIALTASQQIQVISLPDMQQSDIINLDFEPYSLAAGADGKLYVSSADNAWEKLRQVDPVSGVTLGQFGHQTYYQSSILRLSDDRSMLYVAETGLSGYGTIDQYGLASSGLPTYLKGYPILLANDYDIAIDQEYQRIYTLAGGTYGIGVTSMASGLTTTWSDGSSYAPYGCAICFLPTGQFIYGGAYGGIRRYNRADGRPLADVPFTGNFELMGRGLAMTQNGHILYATSEWTGNLNQGIAGTIYHLGLIGAPTLTMTPPSVAPTIYAGQDQSVTLSQGASVTASPTGSSSSLPVVWQVVTGPGGASLGSTTSSSTSINFSAPGTYQLRATTTDGSLVGSDDLNIVVAPDPAAISVTATGPIAATGLANGQLTFSRTGAPTGALAVSYAVSGTARNGIDYTSLSGTVTIPDGASSAVLNVVPLTAPSPAETIIATITPMTGYTVGASQQATIALQKPAFTAWAGSLLGTYDPSLQTPTANPASDGIANLLKYAFNLDPTLPESQGMPVSTTTAPGDGKQYLTISYTQRQNAADIAYVVEVSSDLVNWTSGASATVPVSSTVNGNGTSTVVVRDLTPLGTAPRFIRVRVLQSP